MHNKPPMHIRYSRLCYYCICQVCNLVFCPFCRSKHHLDRTRYDVCSRCLDRPDPRPRLDCDFFMHFRKNDVFRVVPPSVKKIDDSDRLFVVLKNGKCYGPLSFKEARKLRGLIGGLIRELYKHD